MMNFETMLKKRHQAEKTMYCIIPFITVIQSKKFICTKSRVVSCQGQKMGKLESDRQWVQICSGLFWMTPDSDIKCKSQGDTKKH